ncbi:hypothetical protein FRB94_001354 [Tulasnella sp. JGI-2019a]|nr:hypothetical protein FRB94_001354 [Tulasnella sp. JGI-2019a]
MFATPQSSNRSFLSPHALFAQNTFEPRTSWQIAREALFSAAGMLRVLVTMKNSPWSSQFQTQQTNLSNWITEIHIGMINVLLEDSGIFINYAAGGYGSLPCPRAITLQISRISYDAILTTAEEARDALYATNGTIHSDVNGWLIPVVNPREFVHAGGHSDEAQSFVSQLDNYWK